ncbi:zinc finger protein 83-like [Penaeus monodon]|uniref:zinc finger protein 83-like n=1 Tax=Penaeus monodon TaxID=6687 RepID=UPI0018A7145C|nr:zinc finger protein 83-like [Penaeus monodon]
MRTVGTIVNEMGIDRCTRKVFKRIHNEKWKTHLVHIKKTPCSSCEICNKDFTEQSYLVRHIRVHIKEKRYSCELCNKIFAKKCLIRRRRVHTNEKPYSCKICSKAFSQTSHVVGHMRAIRVEDYNAMSSAQSR